MKTKTTFAIAMLWVMALSLHAATLTVTSTADSGAGTLRDALAVAVDGDTIDASGVSGTILLTSGELVVSNGVTILGPGPNSLAVDGNAAGRVFRVTSNSIVSMSGLTIRNGLHTDVFPNDQGGGVYMDHAALTLSNCVVSGNQATNATILYPGSGFYTGQGGGVYNDFGQLTLIDCKFTGNVAGNGGGSSGNFAGHGGAIYNDHGNLVIRYSTLSGNTANSGAAAVYSDQGSAILESSSLQGNATMFGSGGAVATYFGDLLVSNCAVSDNNGGGIDSFDTSVTVANSTFSRNSAGYGGALYNTIGTLTLLNSTLSSNTATYYGGAILNEGDASVRILNSTLSGNTAGAGGGDIYNESQPGSPVNSITIASTILQVAGSGTSIVNVAGSIISLGYNLSSDNGGGVLIDSTDLTNTDPLLGPLQDNGGPTFTHALLPGSPAIDKGINFAGSATDQRGVGFARMVDDPSIPNAPGGDGTDIGAYEVQSVPPPPDSDGDGVPDSLDQCPNTPAGAIVDTHGCSIDQLVPCAGPVSGGKWKNHGQYVCAVVQTANAFLKAGLITRQQWKQIVTSAACSRCGWNHRSDHDGDRDWHRDWDCDRDRGWGGKPR